MSLGRFVPYLGLLCAALGCQSSGTRYAQRPTPSARVNKPSTVQAKDSRPESRETRSLRLVAHTESTVPDEEQVARASVLASVDELSLDILIAEVQTAHPSVEAMYAAWQAASQRYPQVISLEDPMFGVTVAPASLGSRDVESAYALEASQKVPWAGKRALRGAAAGWEASSAAHDIETTQQKLAEVAELAFWDYFVTWQQIDLNNQNAMILKSYRDNALSRYETGLVTQQDVLQADVELANLEQRHIELERMEKVAAGRINVLLRRRPTAPLPPPPKSLTHATPLLDQETLLSIAIEERPEISAARSRVQAEEAKLALTYKNYYPDGEFFGRYDTFWQPRDTQSDLRGQVGVRVNMPIYHNRLDAAVCEAMQQVAKARAEHDQLVLDAQAEVQAAHEQVRESERTSKLYSQKLLPAAEQNVEVARSNYDNSKINFLDLATAQRQLIEAREKQLQTQVELRRRLATLRRVTGSSLSESRRQIEPADSASE